MMCKVKKNSCSLLTAHNSLQIFKKNLDKHKVLLYICDIKMIL